MKRSLLEITEDLAISPGPGLLRHAAAPLDLAAHRTHYGDLPQLDLVDLLALVDAARVRGRGGAGFPFGRKLRAAADHAGAVRRPVVVINASEGEPASAKDAALAEVAPHLVLDGAAVAAGALGARDIHVVVPGDRPRARAFLTEAVRERTDRRLKWHVHVAEPRFVAGQARAVLELMAGRPGLPVTAWKPEAMDGHRGRPTLLSNAETWAHVGRLALVGLRTALTEGTTDEPGTTLLTIHAPGRPVSVVEVEHGARLVDVLPASARGGPVLIGGFHGTWATWDTIASSRVSASHLKERGATLGAGAVICLGPDGCALEVTAQVVAHLAGQSARRCGPCLNGLPALSKAVTGLLDGTPGSRGEAERLAGVVTGRGACAHPDGTARLVSSLLGALGSEVDAHAERACTGGTTLREVAS